MRNDRRIPLADRYLTRRSSFFGCIPVICQPEENECRFLHPGHSDPDAISVVTHTYTESQFISVKSVTDSIQAVQDSSKPERYWRPSSYERTNRASIVFVISCSVILI